MDLPFEHYPGVVDCSLEEILECVQEHLQVTTFTLRNKVIEMKYRSCVFGLGKEVPIGGYVTEKTRLLDPPSLILELKELVEEKTKEENSEEDIYSIKNFSI